MRRLFSLALVAGLAMMASGCIQTAQNGSGPPGTSAEGYRNIAIGVGQVIGKTKADERIAELTAYCTELQVVANVGGAFVPEKHQRAAQMAQAAINAFCSEPPRNVTAALANAVDAVEAVQAVQKAP